MSNIITMPQKNIIDAPQIDTPSLFIGREAPWGNVGTDVRGSLTTEDAVYKAKLNWNVIQTPAYGTPNGNYRVAKGNKLNWREDTEDFLGMVTNQYEVLQNHEALGFMDLLLEEGAELENAGCSHNSKKVWLQAKMPTQTIDGEEMGVYLTVINSHDGKGALIVAITPIRIICQNMFNLALKKAERKWSCIHSKSMRDKIVNAKKTLFNTQIYMEELIEETGKLKSIILSDDKVEQFIDTLIPLNENETSFTKIRRTIAQREELRARYFDAPDLKDVEKSAYRFINAVSDFTTHTIPFRKTKNGDENRFFGSVVGGKEMKMVDNAYAMIKEVA